MTKRKRLDDKGRCCGRKPLVYKRPPHLFCFRCDAAFDPQSGEQIENWAYASGKRRFHGSDYQQGAMDISDEIATAIRAAKKDRKDG